MADVEKFEYSFVWYREMNQGDTTYYTQPFRTKVKAENFEQAKEMVTNFASGKMKLVVIPESKFSYSNLSKMKKELNKISKELKDIFSKFN